MHPANKPCQLHCLSNVNSQRGSQTRPVVRGLLRNRNKLVLSSEGAALLIVTWPEDA